jgi:hypothetical protein
MGNRWLNGWTVVMLAAAAIGTIGLRSFAQPPVATESAPDAQADDAADEGDDVLSGVAGSPGPIIRTACCIPSEDRCVNPMTISECSAVRGVLLRHCRLCQIRIAADDGFVFDDEETVETPAPVLNPTTVVQLVASFMLP